MDPVNGPSSPPGADVAHPPSWAATTTDEPATQILVREPQGLPRPGLHEIGKLITADTRELFVSCDAAEALRQQIEHLGCIYLALHDVGTVTSRQLLRQLAAHGGSAVRKLVIRQQGFGTTLATLEYALFQAPGLPAVQIYSTAADTTPHGRQAVAQTLMALSTASVLLLGEAPGPGAANALRTTMQAVHTPGWICPNLLIVPLGPAAAAAAAAQSSQVVQRHGMLVRATPQPARPSDAWSYILGFWQKNTGRGRLAPQAGSPIAPTQPHLALNLPPAPATPPPLANPVVSGPAATPPAPPDGYVGLVQAYVDLITQMTGLLSCCVFDISSGAVLGQAGRAHSGAELARQGLAILNAQQMARLAMGLGEPTLEILISSDRHHQVVRPLPGHDAALHCVLDRNKTNQSLVRFQLQRLDGWLKQQPRGR